MARSLSISLPRGWPKRVKQALLHAVGLERLALAEVRSGLEHSPDPRARMTAEMDALRELVRLQAEELRILRARLEHVPAPERPHYPPAERLAILLLRSKRGWNATETARRFALTPATIASWMHRLDEQGQDALVKTAVPVNRFDGAVRLLAHELHQAAPGLGRRKKADVLARAGLHLAASTVRRMLETKPPSPRPPAGPAGKAEREVGAQRRAVTAKRPHHVWHADITTIGIGAPGFGWWAPWWPFSLILRWALSWHIAVVIDHFSRALVAFAVFRKEPTALEICSLLDHAVKTAGGAPRYIISDQGSQFQDDYRAWCKKNGARPRFGAVGRKGSIAVVERFILSLKAEFLWKTFVPASLARMQKLVRSYQRWYNQERPHEALAGCTPAEVLRGVVQERVPLEPRARFPFARGDPNVKRCRHLTLAVSYVDGRKELPVVRLRPAA